MTDSIKSDIEAGAKDLYVEYDINFDEDILAVEPTYIQAYYNSTKNSSATTFATFKTMMSLYQEDVILDRVDEQDIITFGYYTTDISPAAGVNPIVIAILPLLIVTFLISGAMSVGVDMVAGEKEKVIFGE